MNTFKVRRRFAVIVVGAICAGVGVLGLTSSVSPIDAVWLTSRSAANTVVLASDTQISKDAVWL